MGLTTEEHNWLRSIEGKIDTIRADVAKITAYGCAQAPRHDDHEKRIRNVEEAVNQSKGALRMAHVLSGAIGACLMFLANRLWK
jgi:hypothetical protein